MHILVRPVAALALIAGLSGCMSGISATKVTAGKNPRGERVLLPAPFLVGRPNPAGSIDWKIECLPDPDEEYAVHAWAFMAKNNVKIVRTKSGMLTSLETDMDTTAVAAKMAEVGGAIANTALDTALTQSKTADTADAKQKTDLIAARYTLLQKVRAQATAKADYQRAMEKTRLAEAALKEATDSGNATAIAAAKKDLQTAQDAEYAALKLYQAADDAVTDAQSIITALGGRYDDPKGNLDEPATPPPPSRVSAPGPVIYRIIEDQKTGMLHLEKVNFTVFGFNSPMATSQPRVSTWGAKKSEKK